MVGVQIIHYSAIQGVEFSLSIDLEILSCQGHKILNGYGN